MGGNLAAALLTLAGCLAITLLLWRNAEAEGQAYAAARFEFRTRELESAIRQRMLTHEQVLRGGVGLITLLEFPNREKWRIYVDHLQLERTYPGIQGVGFAKRILPAEKELHIRSVRAEGFPDYTLRPPGERDEYTAIMYLEPFDWRNRRAFGYDMFSEPVRHAAMARARDTGQAALSGKVTLVQETDRDVQAGFLMYLPVYRKGADTNTVAARREALIGYVYSPFRANDLMRGTVGRESPDLDFQIYDGSTQDRAAMLYDSGQPDPLLRREYKPLFSRTSRMFINATTWTLQFHSLPQFELGIDHRRSGLILLTGITISLLISAVVWSLARTRQCNADLENRVGERTADLNREVAERQRAEIEILKLNEHLERRVVERTAELEQMHRQLVEASRRAGMAEVATSVLHNVGNVLNSVNVSSTLVADRLRNSKAAGLEKLAGLLREHERDLAHFLQQDPRGKQIPTYLGRLAQHLGAEQSRLLEETESLRKNVEHIRDIVAMQQSYGRLSGLVEPVAVTDLLEDSLRMNASLLSSGAVQVIREYETVPAVTIDKHRVIQILVNLIRNALQACLQAERPDGRIALRVTRQSERIRIVVSDNGVGIAPENLVRIFSHGFTTRRDGHGFGLHSGALAAKELGGSLTARSEGVGQGAAFTLELPLRPPEKSGGSTSQELSVAAPAAA